MNDEDAVSIASRAAEAGGEVALRGFRADIAVEVKGDKTDLVTQADRDAQRRVVEVVREERTEDAIVGEEEDELKEIPPSGPVWVIDPIDGTNNFVRDVPLWATSVAAVEDGEAVAAANVLPALDDTYVSGSDGVTLNGDPVRVSERDDPEAAVVAPLLWWGHDERAALDAVCRELGERFGDLRRYGSAQATLSMIAAGQVDGAVSDVVGNPWDTVAGVHMVRQAGGTVTDAYGDRWEPGAQGIVASNGEIHDDLVAAAQAGLDARE